MTAPKYRVKQFQLLFFFLNGGVFDMVFLCVSLACGLVVLSYYVGLRRGTKKSLGKVSHLVAKKLREVEQKSPK